MKKAALLFLTAGVCLSLTMTGCLLKKGGGKSSAEYEQEIAQLQKQIETLSMEKEAEINRLTAENTKLAAEKKNSMEGLEPAQKAITEALQKEILDGKAKVAMTDRGIVVTMLGEILFEPGKDALKTGGDAAVKKIAGIIGTQAVTSDIIVEGNTDNDPIKYSGWKSNWELSSARALSVLHAMTGKDGVKPEKIGFGGFGEYRPVASNSTAEGKKQNRRVDIVILPASMSKERPAVEPAAVQPAETPAAPEAAKPAGTPAKEAASDTAAKDAASQPQGE